MRFFITSALLAALGVVGFAALPSSAEAGFFRKRDGTPREPVKKAARFVGKVAGHHCHRGQGR